MENKVKMGIKDLYNSLMLHRGEQLTEEELDIFNDVAEKLADNINIYDCMVCYEPALEIGDEEELVIFEECEAHIQFDIVTDGGLILHIAKYIKEDINNFCYLVEKDAKIIICGYLKDDEALDNLKDVINKFKSNING